MSAMGVAGFMCTSDISKATLFLGFLGVLGDPLVLGSSSFNGCCSWVLCHRYTCCLICHFSWVLLVSGAARVLGAAGVSVDALVLGAAGFSGPTFTLGAALQRMSWVHWCLSCHSCPVVLLLGSITGANSFLGVGLFAGAAGAPGAGLALRVLVARVSWAATSV